MIRLSPATSAASDTDFGACIVMSTPGLCSRSPSRMRPSTVSVPGTLPARTASKRDGVTFRRRPRSAAPFPMPPARLPVLRVVLRVVAVLLEVAGGDGRRGQGRDGGDHEGLRSGIRRDPTGSAVSGHPESSAHRIGDVGGAVKGIGRTGHGHAAWRAAVSVDSTGRNAGQGRASEWRRNRRIRA